MVHRDPCNKKMADSDVKCYDESIKKKDHTIYEQQIVQSDYEDILHETLMTEL